MTDSYVFTDGKGNFFNKAAVVQPDGSFADLVVMDELPAGSNLIGKTGYQLKHIAGSTIVRPADTTAYAIGDAVSNSTSAPVLFELDLESVGAVAGQAIQIQRFMLAFNAKPAVLPLVNIYFSRTTFSNGVNGAVLTDNLPLAIPNAINAAGGATLQCDVQSSSAINCRVAWIGPPIPMVLASTDTKLYGCIQAANAFTPTSAMEMVPNLWVALL